jgi:serine/threonine protein kinase
VTASESEPARDGVVDGSGAEAPDAADLHMADVLRGSRSGAELRRQLQHDTTPVADDLRGRLDALEFVERVVGGGEDMPSRVGAYLIRGVLGRGGMGTVYLGWQPELEREVALKVLSPGYAADPTMRKRFRAEARATAALHHRHIVPIYDYGEDAGVLFFAMERVHGLSLDKHIAAARRQQRRPLEPLDAARRFAGVADALGLAHRRRLLHRDVKPGNIMVGQDGTLALTDFGLAKALDHASMHLTSKGGGFLGTLHYSSPEQALGGDLSPASDLYSLGVTMFEAITGELPLHGKTPEALLQAILHGTPRRLRECIHRPPRDLEAVIDKLLSREPADRYQDGEDLARDLQRVADGEPVHIRRLPLHVRLWRRMRKNPVLSGAIAAAAVLLLATIVLLSVWRRERGQTLVLRHQEHLVEIAKGIGSERGEPWGPPSLLFALTGFDVPPAPPSEVVLRALQRAERELPGDEQVAALRAAWLDDPAPKATALLREGRGLEALQLLDGAIESAVAARTGDELVTELRLYRLYLARAIANLTAAVARPNDARTNLALAGYLRPGAVFPRTLLDVLDVVQDADAAAALHRLAADLGAAAPERLRVVGALLWAAAGVRPLAHANLMDFGGSWRQRRALHEQAQAWFHPDPDACREAGEPVGLAAVLAAACREVVERLSEPDFVRERAERLNVIVDTTVHPASPLQGWRIVMQMLMQSPQRAVLVDRDGRPLPPGLELAAWDDLLRLSLPRSVVQLWLGRFEQLRADHPNLPGIARVAACLHEVAGSPDALRLADAWIVQADGDPEAWLCRFRVRLRLGQLAEARDDAIIAVQESIDAGEGLAAVGRALQAAMRDLAPGTLEAARVLQQQFQALADGLSVVGGRR